MRARILDASIRVLREQGGLAFTTTRVAEEADISVGSLYQYFPNKHALIAALHEDDIGDGAARVKAVLDRRDGTPRQKLREIVFWFFSTEAEEAATLGVATADIHVFLRDGIANTANAQQIAAATRSFAALIEAASTVKRTSVDSREAALFAMTSIESIGKALAAREPSPKMVRVWAEDTATMLANHLSFE